VERAFAFVKPSGYDEGLALEVMTNPTAHAFAFVADREYKRAEQAEVEVEKLKCCGNCHHRDEETRDYYGSYFVCLTEFKPKTNFRHIEVDCEDRCRFTPSRWTARGSS
jgi:phage FluMu gp28-like protein